MAARNDIKGLLGFLTLPHVKPLDFYAALLLTEEFLKNAFKGLT